MALLRSDDLYPVSTAGQPGQRILFPPWQFAGDGAVPGLRHLLPHVPSAWTPTDVVEWMTTPNESLPRAVSPLDWLTFGEDPETVAAAPIAELVTR